MVGRFTPLELPPSREKWGGGLLSILEKNRKNLRNYKKKGETLAAHFDNFILVVRGRNMNKFSDFHVRVAPEAMNRKELL